MTKRRRIHKCLMNLINNANVPLLKRARICKVLANSDKLNFEPDASDAQVIEAVQCETTFFDDFFLASSLGVFTPSELTAHFYETSDGEFILRQYIQDFLNGLE